MIYSYPMTFVCTSKIFQFSRCGMCQARSPTPLLPAEVRIVTFIFWKSLCWNIPSFDKNTNIYVGIGSNNLLLLIDN